jgi:Rrf2 family protein
MKLSTRTRYGIRAALELAQAYGQGPLQIKVIAERQDISIKYLEHMMTMLRSAGFIRGLRGSKGGYVLSREPSQIKLSEIFVALEGPLITVECLEDEGQCERAIDCVARQVWLEVQNAVLGVLDSITLQDMVNRAKDGKTLHYQI